MSLDALAALARETLTAATQAAQGTPEPEPPPLTDDERADMAETVLAEKQGTLIPAIDFEQALAAAFKTVASALECLPDVLERDAGIDGPAVERCQTVIGRVRDDLYASLTGKSEPGH